MAWTVSRQKLKENGFQESIAKYTELLSSVTADSKGVLNLGQALSGVLGQNVKNLAHIMDTVTSVLDTEADCRLVFDPTLVTQHCTGYYTGTIFEVSVEGLGYSVAGGGRYDKMIGKFTGMDTPACGFSIGFERIVGMLLDKGFTVPLLLAARLLIYLKRVWRFSGRSNERGYGSQKSGNPGFSGTDE